MEEHSEERHDYYYDELFAMAGSTKNCNYIILNIGMLLKAKKKSGCDVFIDGIKLEIEKMNYIFTLIDIHM